MDTIETTAASAARYSRGAIVFHWLIALLIIGNVLGALKHQFLDHDGTLRRMIPWLR